MADDSMRANCAIPQKGRAEMRLSQITKEDEMTISSAQICTHCGQDLARHSASDNRWIHAKTGSQNCEDIHHLAMPTKPHISVPTESPETIANSFFDVESADFARLRDRIESLRLAAYLSGVDDARAQSDHASANGNCLHCAASSSLLPVPGVIKQLIEYADHNIEEWAAYEENAAGITFWERFKNAVQKFSAVASLPVGESTPKPRRLLDDNKPDGYMESNRDYVLNNIDLCVQWLDRATSSNDELGLGESREPLPNLPDQPSEPMSPASVRVVNSILEARVPESNFLRDEPELPSVPVEIEQEHPTVDTILRAKRKL
jgi:hypothetical protein